MSANQIRREGLFARIEGPAENVVWLNILDARAAVRLLEEIPTPSAPAEKCGLPKGHVTADEFALVEKALRVIFPKVVEDRTWDDPYDFVEAAMDVWKSGRPSAGARPQAGKGPYGTSQAEQELPRQRAATVALKAKLDCTACPCARCAAEREFVRALAKDWLAFHPLPYAGSQEHETVAAVRSAARRVVAP